MGLVRRIARRIRRAVDNSRLPARAKAEVRADRPGLPAEEAERDPAIHEAVGWIGRAQDRSASADGGVAGWAPGGPTAVGRSFSRALALLVNCEDRSNAARYY